MSSCKLLNFNVEDILALPRLKVGSFTKNIKRIDISKSIKEVVKIQDYQAKERGINLEFTLHGFPAALSGGYDVWSDEQRFQQVMLNYQSNALKFTNTGGKILISVQFVKGFREGTRVTQKEIRLENQKIVREYGMDDLSSSDDSEDDFYEQEWDHKIILTV